MANNFIQSTDFSLEELLDKFEDSLLNNLHTALPAKVHSYSIANNYLVADLEILIKKDNDDNEYTDYPILPSVPVQMPSGLGGDAFINVPLNEGDNGLIIFCETGIDSWLNSDGSEVKAPSQILRHALGNAVFLPGVNPFGKTFNNLSTDNVVINNESGGVTIHSNNHFEVKDVATGQKIKLGNSPTQTTTVFEELDFFFSDTTKTDPLLLLGGILAQLDTIFNGLGVTTTFATQWTTFKAKVQCNKVNIPPYTET